MHKVLLLQILHAHGHLVQQFSHVADRDLLPGVEGMAESASFPTGHGCDMEDRGSGEMAGM